MSIIGKKEKDNSRYARVENIVACYFSAWSITWQRRCVPIGWLTRAWWRNGKFTVRSGRTRRAHDEQFRCLVGAGTQRRRNLPPLTTLTFPVVRIAATAPDYIGLRRNDFEPPHRWILIHEWRMTSNDIGNKTRASGVAGFETTHVVNRD